MASVEVDVDLVDFHDEELVNELEERGYVIGKNQTYVLISKKDLETLYYDYIGSHVGFFESNLDKIFLEIGKKI